MVHDNASTLRTAVVRSLEYYHIIAAASGASTEASPQPDLTIKGDISVRFYRFILLLMFVQGYKKKNLQTKDDNISCSYRTTLFVQASRNSMYCIYSIHSNVANTL